MENNRPEFTEEQKQFIRKVLLEWYVKYSLAEGIGKKISIQEMFCYIDHKIFPPKELDDADYAYLDSLRKRAEDLLNGQ